MDYVAFHQNLLGIDPEKTPAEYRLTALQVKLYRSAQMATPKHGFMLRSGKSLESWEHFLATFILAYAQTPTGRVVFAVSPVTNKWAGHQIRSIARHIFQARARLRASKESVQQLYDFFNRLSMASGVLQMAEPDRWVAYGFHDQDLLPPWMRGHLLHADRS